MNIPAYRRLKTGVGALTLAACALCFADIADWVSAGVARVVLWPQFAPSLSGLLRGLGWVSAGCVAVLLLTLVFGRVYCAMLCPLGVLMDAFAWLTRRTGKKRKLEYRPARNGLRAGVVAVCGAGIVLGSAVPLALLDPLSVFGKITAATLRPAAAWVNHLASGTGWIAPASVSPVAWTTAGVAAGLLGLVAAASILRGRLWCNTVCPVGAVLGFFSRFALFRLAIAKESCTQCTMCTRVCPAQCCDFKNHSIDHSRCVMCFDCARFCKRSGITLQPAWKRARAPVTIAEELGAPALTRGSAPGRGLPGRSPLTRRTFLAASALLPAAALTEDPDGGHGTGRRCRHREGQGGGETPDPNLTSRNKRPVLPPGAVSLEHFRRACTACHLCVANCPDQVLVPSITEHGLAGFLQVFMDFNTSFCSYNCSNCSQVCPTGAILPVTVEERKTIRTGIVNFFEDRCIVKTEGTSCGACSEHCPTQAIEMVPWRDGLPLPKVHPCLCIGCGGCEYICPAVPERAMIVEGLPVHEQSRRVEMKKENTVRKQEEDFPF